MTEKEKYSTREIQRQMQDDICRIKKALLGDELGSVGLVQRFETTEENLQKVKVAHYNLANEYKADKAKIYGIGATVAAIFGTASSFLKDLIFKH